MRYLHAVRDAELKRRLGSVTEYHGLVVESAGPDVFVGELCEVHSRAPERSVAAEVIGIRNGRVLLMPYEELRGVTYGAEVVATGRSARAAVGAGLLGRVVDAFGAPLDNGPPLALAAAQPLYPSPINPLALAIAGGATYVARGFSGQQKQLVELIKGGIQHRGFALIDVFSPCVTYNKDNTYQWFRPRVKALEELGHDPADFRAAMERACQWGDEIPVGLFWKQTGVPALDELEPVLAEGGPLAHRPLGVDPKIAKALIEELM